MLASVKEEEEDSEEEEEVVPAGRVVMMAPLSQQGERDTGIVFSEVWSDVCSVSFYVIVD